MIDSVDSIQYFYNYLQSNLFIGIPAVPKKVSAKTRCPLYWILHFLGKKKEKHKLIWSIFSYDMSNQYKWIYLRSKETPNITLFLIFAFHLFHIFNWLIKDHVPCSNGYFRWLLWNFSPHQICFMLLLLLFFYSHLHLLQSLAPLRIDWFPWQLVEHAPLNWEQVEVTGKRFNNGVGLGLEISINCFFMEMQELQHGWKELGKIR